MSTILEDSIPTIHPSRTVITRRKVLNMDTLHDCRYVSRGDLVTLPDYGKDLFLEGLALHLKRTEHITDIPIDPEESNIAGNKGILAEMIEELFPNLEGAEHPSFSDLEEDMASYFVAAGYNILSTREDEGLGGISVYDNSPSLTSLLKKSTSARHAQFDVYKEILVGPGMMYTTADAGFKIFGDLAKDHPLVTAFFTPQTVADSAGKSYKQLGANLNLYRSFTTSPTTNFTSISNIFTSDRNMRFEYIVDSFEGEKLWNFKYKISGPPGEQIFDFDAERKSGSSLPACGFGYVSGLPIVENDLNPHLDDQGQKDRIRRSLRAQFSHRPSMLNTESLLNFNMPEIFLDMKRCQDSDQALAAYYANNSEEMRGRVVFVTGDKMCFLLAILLGLPSVLSLQTTGGTYMWYWSPKTPFRAGFEAEAEVLATIPEPSTPVLSPADTTLLNLIVNTIITEFISRPLSLFRSVGGGEEQNVPSSHRDAFKDVCNLAGVHLGNIIAKKYPGLHDLALLSNAIQKAEYSKITNNIHSKKSALIDLRYALSALKVSETEDIYEVLRDLQTNIPAPIEHIAELYDIIESETPIIIDALLHLLKELGHTKWPPQIMSLIGMVGEKSNIMSRVLLSMAILSLLDAPMVNSTPFVNTGSSVYWSIYGFKDQEDAGEDIYYASLNYIINDDINSIKHKNDIVYLISEISRLKENTSFIPRMRSGINTMRSTQIPISTQTPISSYGGKRGLKTRRVKTRRINTHKRKQHRKKRFQTRRKI